MIENHRKSGIKWIWQDRWALWIILWIFGRSSLAIRFKVRDLGDYLCELSVTDGKTLKFERLVAWIVALSKPWSNYSRHLNVFDSWNSPEINRHHPLVNHLFERQCCETDFSWNAKDAERINFEDRNILCDSTVVVGKCSWKSAAVSRWVCGSLLKEVGSWK